MRKLNANYGTVRTVSHDRSEITIGMPTGGSIQCRNEGFEVGQVVCFVLDALGRRVIKVLPKDIADMQVYLGMNPELQEALRDDAPEPEPEVADNDDFISLEVDNVLTDHGTDEGPVLEEYLDCLGEEIGENDYGEEFGTRPEDLE